VFKPDRLVARRGDAGIKLFHLGGGGLTGPLYAYVHDAYHPLPNQRGEGKPGSGLLIRWQEREGRAVRTVVHAIAVDDYGTIAGWHLRSQEGRIGLEGSGGSPTWTLQVEDAPLAFRIEESTARTAFRVSQDAQGVWQLGRMDE
jgi:hypothetical protein